MIFFTADHHFGHSNILKHCPDRPWNNVSEMNEALIKNYQEVVQPKDTVYLLGDFSFKDPASILRRLPGNKHLIIGNHDWDRPGRISKKRQDELIKSGVANVKDVHLLQLRGEDDLWIWLSHYAHRSWPRMWGGSWHLYGHSHGNLSDPGNLSTDVGVDCWDYYPVSLDQLKTYFEGRSNVGGRCDVGGGDD